MGHSVTGVEEPEPVPAGHTRCGIRDFAELTNPMAEPGFDVAAAVETESPGVDVRL